LAICDTRPGEEDLSDRRPGAEQYGRRTLRLFRTVLRDELRKAGYVEGQNVVFEFRSADSNIDRLGKLAAELVELKVDVIVTRLTPSAHAAQQATREIPIVAHAGDMIGTGLVASLARPGGNVTGVSSITSELHGKCVELFHDMLPSARRVAALINAADISSKPILDQIQHAGKATGIEIGPVLEAGTSDEIDAAFASIRKEGADGVVVQGSFPSRIAADLALKHRMAAATSFRPFAESGGLMSYSASFAETFRIGAVLAIKILQGAKPADLPVEQPTKFDLVINLKTAKALGIAVPPTLLARADEVIE
jgi:putative ABC transport system substrate-binding protein